jgi:hypothetical protein
MMSATSNFREMLSAMTNSEWTVTYINENYEHETKKVKPTVSREWDPEEN